MSDKSVNDVKVVPPPSAVNDNLTAPHQVIYTDQMATAAFGPYVSRLVFALENHVANSRDPVVTIVIPTVALHQLATQILAALADKTHNVELIRQYEAFTKVLQS